MFKSFSALAIDLRSQFVEIYWILIVPVTLIVFLLEFFKEESPTPGRVIRRVFVSVIMLLSFDLCTWMIIEVGNGVTHKIDGISKLGELAQILAQSIKNIDINWFSIRKSLIYLLGLLSYLLAYIGVFTAKAVIQFSWAILYVCSPFMILAYISEKTAGVTGNLYRGLVNVMLWNMMAAVLGVLLLEFAKTPSYNQENFLTVIIINLCIAVSLLMVPFTVKSLLGDAMVNSASMMAAVPALAVTRQIKQKFKTGVSHTGLKGGEYIRNSTRKILDNTGRGLKRLSQNKRLEKIKAKAQKGAIKNGKNS